MAINPLRPTPKPATKPERPQPSSQADKELFIAILDEDPAALGRALDAGASPDAKHPGTGWPALAQSIIGGAQGCASALLRAGADPNATNPDGCSAAMIACAHRHPRLLAELLAAGADPSLRDDHGESALNRAAEDGQADSLNLLARAGADLDAENAKGCTAAMIAASEGHLAALTALGERGADLLRRSAQGATAESGASGACADLLRSLREAREMRDACPEPAGMGRAKPSTL